MGQRVGVVAVYGKGLQGQIAPAATFEGGI
jgi:hypothetical protein